jgi:hypothetical protein
VVILVEVKKCYYSPGQVAKSPLNKEHWLFFKPGKNEKIYILASFNWFFQLV